MKLIVSQFGFEITLVGIYQINIKSCKSKDSSLNEKEMKNVLIFNHFGLILKALYDSWEDLIYQDFCERLDGNNYLNQ